MPIVTISRGTESGGARLASSLTVASVSRPSAVKW